MVCGLVSLQRTSAASGAPTAEKDTTGRKIRVGAWRVGRWIAGWRAVPFATQGKQAATLRADQIQIRAGILIEAGEDRAQIFVAYVADQNFAQHCAIVCGDCEVAAFVEVGFG